MAQDEKARIHELPAPAGRIRVIRGGLFKLWQADKQED
jgi:hypothetical protein